MSCRISRARFMSLGLLGVVQIATVGCGTLLYPARKGQPAGQLDWGVVALDAVGLLFFFVPGVIAFAVDFNNGTIYLPPEEAGGSPLASADLTQKNPLTPIATSSQQLTPEAIEQTLAQHTGRDIRLVPGTYRTKALDRLDQFWTTRSEFEVG
ncbi:hypothetical protein ETAA8_37630 [Anatilimnocola aggregata]|uniref:Uncharacterized protein n=1 Tax=Anatilimnocola aggregata TaxID=2528021 RepID=A0A517YEI5_9BACT|nr:hypothetical protein [Anatilimnocola aggregata]QDU28660.1 hypothetical protein ETAA8_37630 [Anatilimnocola aggregata]